MTRTKVILVGAFILALGAGKAAVLFGQITVVDRLDRTTVNLVHVTAFENPFATQRG